MGWRKTNDTNDFGFTIGEIFWGSKSAIVNRKWADWMLFGAFVDLRFWIYDLGSVLGFSQNYLAIQSRPDIKCPGYKTALDKSSFLVKKGQNPLKGVQFRWRPGEFIAGRVSKGLKFAKTS